MSLGIWQYRNSETQKIQAKCAKKQHLSQKKFSQKSFLNGLCKSAFIFKWFAFKNQHEVCVLLQGWIMYKSIMNFQFLKENSLSLIIDLYIDLAHL